MTSETQPRSVEMPWRVESEMSGKALDKIKEALLRNPDSSKALAEDRLDPSSVFEFETNGSLHRLNVRHQDYDTNTREVRLMMSSDNENAPIRLNLLTKYQLNRDGSKTYFGSGELSIRTFDSEFYGNDALDKLETAFPEIFPQNK